MKRLALFLLSAAVAVTVTAQNLSSANGYHRSTLSIIPVVHMQDSFASEILSAAEAMPFPDRYNNMDRETRPEIIKFNDKVRVKELKDTTRHKIFDQLLAEREVAKEAVMYWFNFNEQTGFNTARLAEEGMYDVSELQKELARGTMSGVVNLADAGDELMGKTFILVNDISYINHAERAAYASAICDVISEKSKKAKKIGDQMTKTNTGLGLFDSAMGLVGSVVSLAGMTVELAADLTKATNELLDIRGFAVCEATYLYQLDWSEKVQNTFYARYYTEDGDQDKIQAFLNDSRTFKLKYIGTMPTTTNNASAFRATKYAKQSEAEQILITCSRTMDEAINNLQSEFPEFRVYTPVSEIVYDNKGKLLGVRAGIGLKEGVSPKKKYAIREMVLKNGKTQYKEITVVKPDDEIWDNRFAVENGLDPEESYETVDNFEQAAQPQPASLGTLFPTKKANLYKGLLLIEK